MKTAGIAVLIMSHVLIVLAVMMPAAAAAADGGDTCMWATNPLAACTQQLDPTIQPRPQNVLVIAATPNEPGLDAVEYVLQAHDMQWTRVSVFQSAVSSLIVNTLPSLESAGLPLFSAVITVGRMTRSVAGVTIPGISGDDLYRLQTYLATQQVRFLRYAAGAADSEDFVSATFLSNGGTLKFADAAMAGVGGLNYTASFADTTQFTAASFSSGSPSASVIDAVCSDGQTRSVMYSSVQSSHVETMTILSAWPPQSFANVVMGRIWAPWLTRSTFVGFRRQILSLQVGGTFLSSDVAGRAWRMSMADLQYHALLISAANQRLAAGSNISIELAYSGVGTLANGGVAQDPLSLAAAAMQPKFLWVSGTYSGVSFSKIDQSPVTCTEGCSGCQVGQTTPASLASCEIRKNQDFATTFFRANCQQSATDSLCTRLSTASLVTAGSSGLFNKQALSAVKASGLSSLVGDNACTVSNSACDGLLQQATPFDAVSTTAAVHGVDGLLILPRQRNNVAAEMALPEHLLAQMRVQDPQAVSAASSLQSIATTIVTALLGYRHDVCQFGQANLVAVAAGLFSTSRAFSDADRLSVAAAESLASHSSLFSSILQQAFSHIEAASTLPVLSLRQDDLSVLYSQRLQRRTCGYKVTLFTRSSSKQVVGAQLTSSTPCTVPITGFRALSVPGLVWVTEYGPDVTTWVRLPGGTTPTVVVADDMYPATSCQLVDPVGSFVGSTVSLTVRCRYQHSMGVVLPLTSVKLAVYIAGYSWTPGKIVAGLLPGDYVISLQLLAPVTTVVSITLRGAHVQGSPLSLQPPAGLPSACALGSHPVIDAGQQCSCSFYGPQGSSSCLEDCSGTNGRSTGCCACACPLGRFGWDCSQTCPTTNAQPCSGHGSCVPAAGVCVCSPGFTGTACERALAPCPGFPTACSGHGTCHPETGTCTCNADYFGTDCSSFCNFLDTCSGHGLCDAAGTCKCSAGWTDAHCSTSPCGKAGACSGHGTCSPDGCRCDEHYYGEYCQLACPGFNGVSSCSGHGGCGANRHTCCPTNGACMCETGWWDSTCSTQCDLLPPPARPSSKVRAVLLVVLADAHSPADAAAIRFAEAGLRLLGTAYLQTTLAAVESGQVPLYSHDDIPMFNGVLLSSMPTTSTVLDSFVHNTQCRRVILHSVPGSAGVPAVSTGSTIPLTGVAQLQMPPTVLTNLGWNMPRSFQIHLPIHGLIPAQVVDGSKCAPAYSVLTLTPQGLRPMDVVGIIEHSSGTQTMLLFVDHTQLQTSTLSGVLTRLCIEWVTRGVRVGTAPLMQVAPVVRNYCCNRDADLAPATLVQGLTETIVSIKANSAALGGGTFKTCLSLSEPYHALWSSLMTGVFSDQVVWDANPATLCDKSYSFVVGPTCDSSACTICTPITSGRRVLLDDAVYSTFPQFDLVASRNASEQVSHAAYSLLLAPAVTVLFHPSVVVDRDQNGISDMAQWVQEFTAQVAQVSQPFHWSEPSDVGAALQNAVISSQCVNLVSVYWLYTTADTDSRLYGVVLDNSGPSDCTVALRGVRVLPSGSTSDVRTTQTPSSDIVSWVPVTAMQVRQAPVQMLAVSYTAVIEMPTHSITSGVSFDIVVQLRHPLGYDLNDASAVVTVSVDCMGDMTADVGPFEQVVIFVGSFSCVQPDPMQSMGNGRFIMQYTAGSPVIHNFYFSVNGMLVPNSPVSVHVEAGWWIFLAFIWVAAAAFVAAGWLGYSCAVYPMWAAYKQRQKDEATRALRARAIRLSTLSAGELLDSPDRPRSLQPSQVLRQAATEGTEGFLAASLAELSQGQHVTPLTISTIAFQADRVKSCALVDSDLLFAPGIDNSFSGDDLMLILRCVTDDFRLADRFAERGEPACFPLLKRPLAVLACVDMTTVVDVANAQSIIRKRCRQGFDGVLLCEVDGGDAHVVTELLNAQVMKQCLVMLADAGGFVWTSREAVNDIHGVLIRNPVGIASSTSHEDLTLASHRVMCAVLERALKVRTDLLVMAVEHVRDLDDVVPSAAAIYAHCLWCPGITPLLSVTVENWTTLATSGAIVTRSVVAPSVDNETAPLSLFDATPVISFLARCAASGTYEASGASPHPSEHIVREFMALMMDPTTASSAFDCTLQQLPAAVAQALRDVLGTELDNSHRYSGDDHQGFWAHMCTMFQRSRLLSDRTGNPTVGAPAGSGMYEDLEEEDMDGSGVVHSRCDSEEHPLTVIANGDDWDVGALASVDTHDKVGQGNPTTRISGNHLQSWLDCNFPLCDIPTVLSTLAHLRHTGVLLNIGATTQREVFAGSDTSNAVESVPDYRFTNLLQHLDTIAAQLTIPALDMLEERERRRITRGLHKLRKELRMPFEQRAIHIWLADPCALSIGSNNAWAAWEHVSSVLHIYVARNHPNLAEAVWYSFLTRFGYSRHQAVLLEAMVSRNPKCNVMSDRLQHELERYSVSSLASLVHRTRYMCLMSASHGLQQDDAGYQRATDLLTQLICITAKQRLLALPSSPIAFADVPGEHYLPHISKLIRRACWHAQSRLDLVGIMRFMDALSAKIGTANACCHNLRACLYDHTRRAAFVDMHLRVQRLMPLPVRDKDAIVVYCETLGYTDESLQLIFGHNRVHFGELLYQEVRQRMHAEDPKAEAFANSVVYTGRLTKAEYQSKLRIAQVYAHGSSYSWPAIVDIALALTTGHGLFASKYMPSDTIAMSGAALMWSFIIAGAVNAAVGSTASFFVHQWASGMVATVIFQRLVAGILISAVVALLGGCIAISSHGIFNALLFAQYTLAYTWFLMLLSALLSQEMGSNWSKHGGRAVFGSCSVLLIPPILVWADVQISVTTAYIVALWIVILMLASQVSGVAEFMTSRFDNLQVPTDSNVLSWHFGPAGGPAECSRTQLLSQAREAFMKATGEAVRRRSCGYRLVRLVTCRNRGAAAKDPAGSKLCQVRAQQYAFERDLLKWYCLTRALPMPLAWSAEWDTLVNAACSAMWLQAHSMREVRGSLLFGHEVPHIVFGAIYFVLVFVDRICRMLVGGGVFLFQPTVDNYSLAVGWATLFVIFASAWFEITMATPPIATADDKCRLLGPDNNSVQRMFDHTIHVRWSYYKSQLLGLLRVMFIAIGVVQAVMLFTGMNAHEEAWYVFFAAIVGYSGIVFGLFNSMFAARKLDTVLAMLVSIIVGLAAGVVVSMATGWLGASIVALTMSGCLFAALAWRVAQRSVSKPIGDDIPVPQLTAALQTSGQRWVGLQADQKSEFHMMELNRAQQLLDLAPELVRFIVPGPSPIALRVTHGLKSSTLRYARLLQQSSMHLLTVAFGDVGTALLNKALGMWEHGDAVVRLVPQQCLATGDSMQGYSAMSVVHAGPMPNVEDPLRKIQIIVGVDWALRDDPEYVAPVIIEAIVHEIAEHAFGFSHADAVLCEMLTIDGQITNSLPVRILRQLTQANVGQLLDILSGTDKYVVDRLVLQLQIDREWSRYPVSLRKVLLSVLEDAPVFPRLNEASLAPGVAKVANCCATDEIGLHARQHAAQLHQFQSALADSPMFKSCFATRAAGDRSSIETRLYDATDDDSKHDIGYTSTRMVVSAVGRTYLACCMAYQLRERIIDALSHREEPCRAPDPAIPTLGMERDWVFGSLKTDELSKYVASEPVHKPNFKLLMNPAGYDTQDPWLTSHKLSRSAQVQVVARVWYLALIGSTLFGREAYFALRSLHWKSSAIRVLQWVMVWVHWLSRRLLKCAVMRCLWGPHTAPGSLLQSIRGLNRTVHRQRSLLRARGCCRWRNRVLAVERHKPYGDITAFAAYPDGNAGASPQPVSANSFHLRWYSGSVTSNFATLNEPSARKGLLRVAHYAILDGQSDSAAPVLRWAKLYMPDASVERTIVYKYGAVSADGPTLPIERRDVLGDADVDEIMRAAAAAEPIVPMSPGALQDSDDAQSGPSPRATLVSGSEGNHDRHGSSLTNSTTHSAHSTVSSLPKPVDEYVRRRVYNKAGLVAFEELSVPLAPDRSGVEVIHGHYKYMSVDGQDVVIEAMYVSHAWTMIIKRWILDANKMLVRSTMPVAVVTVSHFEQRAIMTQLQYHHPRHPTFTSVEVPNTVFFGLSRSFFTSQPSEAEWLAAESQFKLGIPVNTPPDVVADMYDLIGREDPEPYWEDDLLLTTHLVLRRQLTVKRVLSAGGVFASAMLLALLVAAAFTRWTAAIQTQYEGDSVVVLVVSAVVGCLAMAWYVLHRHVSAESYYGERLPVHVARMHLWRAWRLKKDGKSKIDAVHAQYMDELLLREAESLQEYWRARDCGRIPEAVTALRQNHEAIKTDLFIREDKQFRSHLVMRVSDLAICASGGDSPLLLDQDELAHLSKLDLAKVFPVVGLDSGTWPMDGGGVASCRRDLVDRMDAVRWHMICEIGHDLRSVQDAYQIEQHVLSVQYVPLWGTNMGSPAQTILSSKPYIAMEMMGFNTTLPVIQRYFVPLLQQLICACAQEKPTAADMHAYNMMFVNLYHYFQRYGWLETWHHPIVRLTWIKVWGMQLRAMKYGGAGLLNVEQPTLQDLDDALEFFVHFLLPLCVPLPSGVPVYHASHHGIQAVLGVVAKVIHGSSLVIWDHGILWRERLMGYCQFQGAQPFVRNSLVGLQRLVACVCLQSADLVVPCTNVSNPNWEAWLGGMRGDAQGAALMWRRISPVVNGMETDKFQVHRDQEDASPTVVMLSHVSPLKDVATAVKAAAVIVNDYKCSQYRLLIYGAIDKDPDYVGHCMSLIAAQGLQSNVFMMGLGSAPKVLPKGWMFLNSSKTEGLPLALGEAGLAGLPVVCTDVGGSRELLVDGPFVYGRVVPPGRPWMLARAQLEVLTMSNGLSEMVSDPESWRRQGCLCGPCVTLDEFTGTAGRRTPDVLVERMMQVKALRRKLGMMFRARVLRDFSMERYLREHEQVIRIANQCSRIRRGLAVYGAELTADYQEPTYQPPHDDNEEGYNRRSLLVRSMVASRTSMSLHRLSSRYSPRGARLAHMLGTPIEFSSASESRPQSGEHSIEIRSVLSTHGSQLVPLPSSRHSALSSIRRRSMNMDGTPYASPGGTPGTPAYPSSAGRGSRRHRSRGDDGSRSARSSRHSVGGFSAGSRIEEALMTIATVMDGDMGLATPMPSERTPTQDV